MSSSDALKWLGVGVAAYLLLKAVRPLAMLHVLLKQQYCWPKFRVIDAELVPEDVRAYLEAGAEQLLEIGFAPSRWVQVTSMEFSQFGDSYLLILRHEELGADVSVAAGYSGIGLRFNFSAQFSDGTRLETAHGTAAMLIDRLVDIEIVDTADPDVKALWRIYEARLRELTQAKQVVRHDPLSAAAAAELAFKRCMDSWLERGTLQPAREPGLFELSLPAALRLSFRFARAATEMARFRAARAALEPGLSLDSEQVRSFQQVRELTERRSTRFGIVSSLLVSGLLFALSMLRLLDARDLVALLGVLLFHELGHFAAMRVLGYRDTSIFFIPFFGAAARGIKRDASIHEQVIVLLAGPVPGLVLAAIVRSFAPDLALHPQARTILDLLIWINLVNLLPIFPLDGGRVVQLLFAHARPLFEVAFRALGALGFLALGIFSQDALLIAIACFMALMIPAARRAAHAARNLRVREELPADEVARVRVALAELRRAQPSLPPAQRIAVLMPLVERIRLRPLGWLGTLSWGSVYGASIAAGLAVLVLVEHRPVDRTIALACQDLSSLQVRVPQAAGTFGFTCKLEDSRRAELMRTLREYSELPEASCLVPPWQSTALDPSAQRARATVLALQAERQRTLQARGATELDLDGAADEAVDLSPALREAMEERSKSLAQAVREAQQQYLAAHGGESQLDAAAGALFLAHSEGGDSSALVERLGRRLTACSVDQHREFTFPSSTGSELTVIGYRRDVRAGASELARYLCEQGCDLRVYWKQSRRGAAPEVTSDL